MLASTARRADATGNGTASNFSFSFKIFENADIKVKVFKTSTAEETTLTLTTDFTITLTGPAPSAGSISLVNSGQAWLTAGGKLATGYTIAIIGDRAYSQPVTIRNQSSFNPDVVEGAWDKITVLLQQLKEKLDRAILLRETSTATSPVLDGDALSDSDNEILQVNAAGTGITPSGVTFASFNADVNATAEAASEAASSEGAAAASASAAATSAANALGSQNAAALSAINAAASEAAAATSASAAQTAETNAETAETNAETAETNAASSASAASTSASTASTQATNAATSATNAASSATSAASSATTASTQATNASTSATNAASSATSAANSATAAASSATDAAASAASAAAAVATHAALTATHGVSGAIVGTTDSQALTNKTINGASNTISNINLASQVTGNLPVGNLAGGTGATSSTFWRGDGAWATPAGAGDVVGPGSSTDNALVRFDSTTGKLLQNSSATLADAGLLTLTATSGSAGLLDVIGDGVVSQIQWTRYQTSSGGNTFAIRKARGSLASPATVVAGDAMSDFNHQAHDGTAFRTACQIRGIIDTVTGTDDLSAYLAFFTRADGAGASSTERMRITKDGAVKLTKELQVAGDLGGIASHNTITGVSDVSANSTGVGTIKFKGATSRDSTGFIKIYIGTTAYYVPVFSAITG